ncbi:putative phosphatidate cytidylyltransferase [Golovinomyces cichoracearum]|uniref:dolichol kinase n=1 Tax=Golovinomyces cichoracearum TaxID=62708 RepID=A0A420J5E1_9PEZI|nr:putative phosphatidate cytidylyltransferase [Golovinomyces cichoracearum]
MPEQLDNAVLDSFQNDQREASLVHSKPHLFNHSHSHPPLGTDGYLLHDSVHQLSTDSVKDEYEIQADKVSEASKSYKEHMDNYSGTDADDENAKKRFIVAKLQQKSLRSIGIHPLSPPNAALPIKAEEVGMRARSTNFHNSSTSTGQKLEVMKETCRKQRLENIRRCVEFGLVAILYALISTNQDIRHIFGLYKRELSYQLIITMVMFFSNACKILKFTKSQQCEIRPTRFADLVIHDPAPFLYPPFLSTLVSLVIFRKQPLEFLPKIILAVASIPANLLPSLDGKGCLNTTHWLISILPIFLTNQSYGRRGSPVDISRVESETLVLLPPLYQSLSLTISCFTKSSLLPAELQLLSVSLIYLLLYAKSPQATILKSLLWGGGIGILVSCTHVLEWSVALSRVPKWRFRRSGKVPTSIKGNFGVSRAKPPKEAEEASRLARRTASLKSDSEKNSIKILSRKLDFVVRSEPIGSLKYGCGRGISSTDQETSGQSDTLPNLNRNKSSGYKWKRSRPINKISLGMCKNFLRGRRKKNISLLERALYSYSPKQARIRRLIYTGYIYLCVLIIILIGIRNHVETFALSGSEPFGWALGYLFGDLQSFRMFVLLRNLQNWIPLPPRYDMDPSKDGWAEFMRQAYFGAANTRLILSFYWISVFSIGLTAVLYLSPLFEVDTRRKIFHFMMLAVLFPATYIDPIFVAFALTLALAVFLLLELIRTARLPPLSKFLAKFFSPFVDERDLRGPVVLSHIFLLIGCAIPLWLTLGSLSRTNSANLIGWDVNSREVSMVAGVICVGMGDSAASLFGRRFGRVKWSWSGGKSFEGSVAFAIAVLIGLALSKAWLRFGGWQANNCDSFILTLWKSGVAACIASLTEAVITGGNDNVIVPVVLWICVKGLEL